MKHDLFSENMKLAEMVFASFHLLYVLPYFGIELGFGEKTVRQICAEKNISVPLFLLVCNLYAFEDYLPEEAELRQVPLEGIVTYLQNSHRDFLEVRMPHTIESILNLARENRLPNGEMLSSFCEKYRQEIVAHFRYEEEVVFPHIRKLLAGEKSDYKIREYESNHGDIDTALEDLKNIIVKYLPFSYSIEKSGPALLNLFMFEYDLRKHTLLEESILIPLAQRLDAGRRLPDLDSVELSKREKQTLAALARGLSNKAIADQLNISLHTVVSHRKSIVRKTGVKTVSGLTLYALFNNLISQQDLEIR